MVPVVSKKQTVASSFVLIRFHEIGQTTSPAVNHSCILVQYYVSLPEHDSENALLSWCNARKISIIVCMVCVVFSFHLSILLVKSVLMDYAYISVCGCSTVHMIDLFNIVCLWCGQCVYSFLVSGQRCMEWVMLVSISASGCRVVIDLSLNVAMYIKGFHYARV